MEKTDDTPKLNGLVETALFVEDLPRACDLYEHILGLEKIKAGDTGCVLRVADQRYLLLVSREAARTPTRQRAVMSCRRVRCRSKTVEVLDTSRSAFRKTR